MIGFTTLFSFCGVIQKMDDRKTPVPSLFFVSPFNVLVPQISFITSQPLPPAAAWQQAAEGESTLEYHHPPSTIYFRAIPRRSKLHPKIAPDW
jgi:hypothetical protein